MGERALSRLILCLFFVVIGLTLFVFSNLKEDIYTILL
ncbi:hypothetical protein JOC95_001336 [Bacillus tianshenii]|jgi:hypothetical protein|uniref:Uncharacterized protein n=1 Tax=Sutcliffiella tianshenii TaxID=1463404 RepID=A0ABS2NYF5_9BACI|nr:hypothetical protein [Bacillus tianshenii]